MKKFFWTAVFFLPPWAVLGKDTPSKVYNPSFVHEGGQVSPWGGDSWGSYGENTTLSQADPQDLGFYNKNRSEKWKEFQEEKKKLQEIKEKNKKLQEEIYKIEHEMQTINSDKKSYLFSGMVLAMVLCNYAFSQHALYKAKQQQRHLEEQDLLHRALQEEAQEERQNQVRWQLMREESWRAFLRARGVRGEENLAAAAA